MYGGCVLLPHGLLNRFIPGGTPGLFDKNMANCGKCGVLYCFSFFARKVAAL